MIQFGEFESDSGAKSQHDSTPHVSPELWEVLRERFGDAWNQILADEDETQELKHNCFDAWDPATWTGYSDEVERLHLGSMLEDLVGDTDNDPYLEE